MCQYKYFNKMFYYGYSFAIFVHLIYLRQIFVSVQVDYSH